MHFIVYCIQLGKKQTTNCAMSALSHIIKKSVLKLNNTYNKPLEERVHD